MLEGVSAKDAILAIIVKYGASHGNGFAIEFAGQRQMPLYGRP